MPGALTDEGRHTGNAMSTVLEASEGCLGLPGATRGGTDLDRISVQSSSGTDPATPDLGCPTSRTYMRQEISAVSGHQVCGTLLKQP